MKIYTHKDYECHRTNEPKNKKPNVANREDFCCDELFEANLDIYIDCYSNSENGKGITFTVFEENSAELNNIKYCPFCGKKFKIIISD